MAAKDLFHQAVKQALLKQQWVITADALKIKIEGVRFEIDLAAEKILAAQKEERKIAVEIKSFINNSVLNDFHVALGQFLNYRLALQMSESEPTLYLAVPFDTFDSFLHERFAQEALKIYHVHMIVSAANTEITLVWKE